MASIVVICIDSVRMMAVACCLRAVTMVAVAQSSSSFIIPRSLVISHVVSCMHIWCCSEQTRISYENDCPSIYIQITSNTTNSIIYTNILENYLLYSGGRDVIPPAHPAAIPAMPAMPAIPIPTMDDGSILVAPFLIDHIEFAAAADAP